MNFKIMRKIYLGVVMKMNDAFRDMKIAEAEAACPDCGNEMSYEDISSDADGNRKQLGYVCKECD